VSKRGLVYREAEHSVSRQDRRKEEVVSSWRGTFVTGNSEFSDVSHKSSLGKSRTGKTQKKAKEKVLG